MYSVVLMAALTAGTTTPSWGWGHGSKGSHGGWGGKHGSHGASDYGGCYGCYRGYGYGGSGCSGGAYYGGYGFGGYGSGSTYAAGCYGAGWYASGCYGAGCAGTPHPPSQVTPPAGPSGAPAPERVPAPKKEEQKTTALDQALLIVNLPADAKLYVDDKLTTATSDRRVFNSPGLADGQEYYYILRAEVVREGKTQSKTKRVLFHARDVIETSFPDLGDLVPVRAETVARP
jgi:uncharacterized protein (TIGR03000 family)